MASQFFERDASQRRATTTTSYPLYQALVPSACTKAQGACFSRPYRTMICSWTCGRGGGGAYTRTAGGGGSLTTTLSRVSHPVLEVTRPSRPNATKLHGIDELRVFILEVVSKRNAVRGGPEPRNRTSIGLSLGVRAIRGRCVIGGAVKPSNVRHLSRHSRPPVIHATKRAVREPR
jgi:hypothetical protein